MLQKSTHYKVQNEVNVSHRLIFFKSLFFLVPDYRVLFGYTVLEYVGVLGSKYVDWLTLITPVAGTIMIDNRENIKNLYKHMLVGDANITISRNKNE